MTPRITLIAAVVVGVALGAPTVTDAEIPRTLKDSCGVRDALDNDTTNGRALPFFLCDDGTPSRGGTQPNEDARLAVGVPQRYRGYKGLPQQATPDPDSGADSNGEIALDVDLSLPDPREHRMPRGGYPTVVMMHGCCGGSKRSLEQRTVDAPGTSEGWHYSNAWFASRGYAVVTYTSRGFVNGENQGSTGTMQLQDRRYEINDLQHLLGQLADTRLPVRGQKLKVDPRNIVVTGGSYGGGFSWMALTDPTWKSPEGRHMRLSAVAPKYGWTDLVQAVVPNGQDRLHPLPPKDGSATSDLLGFPKQTITAGLYGSGKGLVLPGSSHTTFSPDVDAAITCLNSFDPYESNPLCTEPLRRTLPTFLHERSAYFQNGWFDRVRRGNGIVPVFSAGTFTDTLFPADEHRRMAERILRADPRYPIQEYYGDYQHFTQNKRTEWSDLCGGLEVCSSDRYRGLDYDRRPQGFSELGITTRLNRFIDHYARPPENRDEPKPKQDVTAALQVCPENATEGFPADGPGRRYEAPSFDRLAPKMLKLRLGGSQTTSSMAFPNLHARAADPVLNERLNGKHCPVETQPAGPGVATYTAPPLDRARVMIGQTEVTVPHAGPTSTGLQLNARLYDVFPNSKAVLVDRGVRRVAQANATEVFDLNGNGWRFEKGHRIRIELAQDASPFIKASVVPSTLTLDGVKLEIPVRR